MRGHETSTLCAHFMAPHALSPMPVPSHSGLHVRPPSPTLTPAHFPLCPRGHETSTLRACFVAPCACETVLCILDVWCHFTVFSTSTICTCTPSPCTLSCALAPSLPPIPIAPERPQNKHTTLCACFMARACDTAPCVQDVWCCITVFGWRAQTEVGVCALLHTLG